MFSAEQASALIGNVPASTTRFDVTVIQFAGIECSWHPEPKNVNEIVVDPYLEITALPVAAIDTVDDSTTCASENEGSGAFGTCTFTAVIGKIVYSGTVSTGVGSTKAEAGAASAAVLDALGHIDPSFPDIRKRTADAWPATIDCVELGRATHLNDVFDAPNLTIRPTSEEVRWAPVKAKLITDHGRTQCLWQDYDSTSGVSVVLATMYADGAWVRELLEDEGTVKTVNIEGVAAAVAVNPPVADGNPMTLWVFDGTNALQINTQWNDLNELYPAAPVLIAALNGLS